MPSCAFESGLVVMDGIELVLVELEELLEKGLPALVSPTHPDSVRAANRIVSKPKTMSRPH